MRFSQKPSAALQTQPRLSVLFCFCFTKIPGSLAILRRLGDRIEESERSEEPASAVTAQPWAVSRASVFGRIWERACPSSSPGDLESSLVFL